jgi:hypothetical protein
MTKAATAKATDPVAARAAMLERLKARRPPDRVKSYAGPDDGAPRIVTRAPAETGRAAPKNLGEWLDDRPWGAFGPRPRLNPAEQAAHDILESMRAADPRAVREAVRRAGDGLDVMLKYLVNGQLQDWRAGAPGYAVDVTSAAAAEARTLGWGQRPRLRQRAPEWPSQVPGERVA